MYTSCAQRGGPDGGGLRLRRRGARTARTPGQQRQDGKEEGEAAGAGAPGAGVRPSRACRCRGGRRARPGPAPGARHAARWPLAAGRWPLAAGRWPLAAGRWPLAAGRWPLAAGRWPLAAGRWPLANYTRAKPVPMSSADAYPGPLRRRRTPPAAPRGSRPIRHPYRRTPCFPTLRTSLAPLDGPVADLPAFPVPRSACTARRRRGTPCMHCTVRAAYEKISRQDNLDLI